MLLVKGKLLHVWKKNYLNAHYNNDNSSQERMRSWGFYEYIHF